MATPALLVEEDPGPLSSQPTRSGLARPQRLWLHLLLFFLTLGSTTVVGMRYAVNFQQGRFPLTSEADIFPIRWVWANLAHLALGLPFSLTLLAILLTHEFGHYFACRRYGVRATLPYLLPAPTLSGTLGAVIQMRSRIRSREALMAIGAFGPIAGFVVAIAMTCLGLALSRPVALPPLKVVDFHSPLLFRLLSALPGALHGRLDAPLLWHPVLVASWIGLLITSLNLVPAGQLDGGHIVYALSPRAHRISTRLCIALLALLGVTQWIGWFLWAGLLLLPGMRHPRVEDPLPLKPASLLLAPIALAILLLTLTREPFSGYSLSAVLHRLHS